MMKGRKLNLTQRIAYNAVFSVLARFLEILIALVTIKLTTNYLGLSGFGDYGIVMAFVYVFSVLADFGLYSLVVRDISVPDADEEKIVNNALTIRLVLGALVMLSSYIFSLFFPYPPQVRLGILVAALGYWLLNGIQVLMGLFQKHLLMDRVSVAEFLGRAVQFLGVVVCVRYDAGFLAIIGTIFLGALANYLLVIRYAKKLVRIHLAFDYDYWRDMLRRASPLAVSAILVLVYFKMDTIFLSVIKGSSAVGIYSLAYKIMENLIFFPSMVVGLTMPLMSRTVETDRKQFESIVQRTLNFLLLTIVPITLGIFAVADKLILLLSRAEFRDSVPVLQFLAVALFFIFLGALFSNILVALQEQKALARIYACGAAFNVAANLYFIPRYSYFGAACTTAATELLVTALMVLVIRHRLEWLPSFGNLLRSGFAGLVMYSALLAVPQLPILSAVLMGAGVYAAVAYAAGGISKEEMRKLFHKET